MKPIVLITDAHTPPGDQLARKYLSEGYRATLTCPPGSRIKTPLVSAEEELLVIEWNRNSPISARNVLLTAINRFEGIDETLLLMTPELEQKLLQETPTETIDRAVDTWIKGNLYLMKAILELYGRQKAGCLALINHVPQEEAALPPPLESALRGSFTAAAEAIFAGSGQADVQVNGFESRTQRIEELADYIFDTLRGKAARTSGKWYRYPPRSGILSAFS